MKDNNLLLLVLRCFICGARGLFVACCVVVALRGDFALALQRFGPRKLGPEWHPFTHI